MPTISYVPAADWSGNDSFVIQVADGAGGFDTLELNVTVNPVNDAPVLNPIGDQQTDIFTPLGFQATASDVDSETLTFSISGAPDNASFNEETGEFYWEPSPEIRYFVEHTPDLSAEMVWTEVESEQVFLPYGDMGDTPYGLIRAEISNETAQHMFYRVKAVIQMSGD